MQTQPDTDGFLPKHGGFVNLITFQKAEIIYDGTFYFAHNFLPKYDRTIDQMIQAARSGKQNIAEGSLNSGTSKEMEIKLTNVARSSLGELMLDYKDFLRTRNLVCWDKNHPYYPRLSELHRIPNPTYETYKRGIENPSPEIAANVLLSLTNVTSYLLAKQLKTLEKEFLTQGGLRERMTQARINVRKKHG